MDYAEVVNKVMSKYRRIRRGKLYRVRQNVSWDVRAAAKEFAEHLRQQYRFDGWLRRDDVFPLLIEREILEPAYENQLKLLYKRLDDYKFQLYIERDNPALTKKTTSNIERTRKTINELLNKISSLDQYTLEGFIWQETQRFILRKVIEPKPRNLHEMLIVEHAFMEDFIGGETLRAVARSEPWRSYWNARKQAAFRYHPLSDEQVALCSFSKMYDGVYKHPEKPPEFVIENDDMLDGWIISVSKEDKKEKPGKQSRETFMMVNSQVEANEVYSKNPTDVRILQQSRQKQLERKGEVKYTEFGDVKQELRKQRLQSDRR